MSRTYQVVETVIVRRVCSVRASSEQEALAKVTGGSSRGLAVGVGKLDYEHVDMHAVAAPSPEVEEASWLAQEALCSAWLTQLHGVLDGFSRPPASPRGRAARGSFSRNVGRPAADIRVLEG